MPSTQPHPPQTTPSRRGPGVDARLPPGPLFLTVNDVAASCGLSPRAIYRAIRRGELRASRLCSRLRIDPTDVACWIAAGLVDADVRTPAVESAVQPRGPANGLMRLLPERIDPDDDHLAPPLAAHD